MEKSIALGAAFNAGWTAFTARPGFWVVLVIAYALAQVALNWLSGAIPPVFGGGVLTAIAALIMFAVNLYVTVRLSLGLLVCGLRTVDGGTPELIDLLAEGQPIGRYLVANVAYSLMTMVGLLLLILPGLYVMTRFAPFGFVVIDHRSDVIETFRRSQDLTAGCRLPLFLFIVLTLVMLVAGSIPFGLGLLVALPVATVAFAHVYRQLDRPASAAPLNVTLAR